MTPIKRMAYRFLQQYALDTQSTVADVREAALDCAHGRSWAEAFADAVCAIWIAQG